MKKYLILSATAILFFALKTSPAHAAEDVFTLHSVNNKDYKISAEIVTSWQTGTKGSVEYISFEPEQNLTAFVSTELGIQDKSNHKIDLNKYNVSAIYKSLKDLETQINRDPEEAVMKVENKIITDFNPGKNGQDLDLKNSIDRITEALDKDSTDARLEITETEPLTSLAQTNNLGVKELVAFGESDFSGSPSNRIFNIKVGVKKETGILLDPGEEFSFNKYLGPVDGEHGFLPELVIKKTGTVPEFGGGLCQVSSTVFRAAMNAGLPITERRNHSYAVQYYAPQGTDATIYPGVQDLKFINNTAASMVIWPEIEKNTLRFYLYGSKDTRQVAFDGPRVFDRKPDGAMKAVWYRTTTMPDGTVKKDTFNSNYQSPALFHKVETFPAQVNTTLAAPSPNTPQTTTPSTPVKTQ